MRRRVAVLAVCGLLACSFAYRAQREFTEVFDVTGYASLYVELPDAPTRVAQLPGLDGEVRFEGVFSALGGTQAVAQGHVQDASIRSEDLGDTLRLFANWPVESEGLVSLQSERLLLPSGMPLSLVAGGGDLRVQSLDADVDIDLGGGDVVVEDARGSVSIFTQSGDVQVATAPAQGTDDPASDGYEVGVFTGLGDVSIRQRSTGATYVECAKGDIEISVGSDEGLDIYVYASDGIDWDTSQVRLDEPGGEWRETLDDGRQALVAIAYAGSVRVRED